MNRILEDGGNQGRIQEALVIAHVDAGAAVNQFFTVQHLHIEERLGCTLKDGVTEVVNGVH